jgi:hypothetical protein
MKKKSEEEIMADDIVYWIKNDISCLHMVSEIKKELKPLSKERFEFWDRIHTIVLNKFGINREI